MPSIVLARDLFHEQIEFPEDVPYPADRRGGRGTSLHLQRGRARDVTVEELDYIKSARPEVYKCLDVLSAPRVPGRTRKRLAAAQEAKAKAAVLAKAEADAKAEAEEAAQAKRDKSAKPLKKKKPKPS